MIKKEILECEKNIQLYIKMYYENEENLKKEPMGTDMFYYYIERSRKIREWIGDSVLSIKKLRGMIE